MVSAKIKTQRMIDTLGTIRAQIADLEQREKELTEQIKILGVGVHSGRLFDANAYWQERSRTDWKSVIKAARVPPRIVKMYTESKPVLCLSLTARKVR